MKTKRFNNKLTLNKKTVANLSDAEMNRQRGGGDTVGPHCPGGTLTEAGPILTCIGELCLPNP